MAKDKISPPRVGDMLLSDKEEVGMTIGIGVKHAYSKTPAVTVEWYLGKEIVGETYIISKSKNYSYDMTLRQYNKLRQRFREKQKELMK